MPRPVLKADLARMFDISRAAVTKRCASTWSSACIGDRVDTDHPLIQAAAAERGVALPKPARGPTKTSKSAPPAPAEPTEAPKAFKSRGPRPTRPLPEEVSEQPEQPDNAGALEDLDDLARTAKPLVDRFGSSRGARDWVIFQKDLQTTIGKSLDNAQARGLVISRELVRSNVIGLIDGVNNRLLGDTPKTLCRQLYALARSGAPVEEAEAMTRQLIGKQLSGLKSRAEKALLNGIDRGNGGRKDLASRADRFPDDGADSA